MRAIVFDKTGTLTTGVLTVKEPAALAVLDPADRAALYHLVAQSAHPKSVAVKRALDGQGLVLLDGVPVVEVPGAGLEATIAGARYRLGRPEFALGCQGDAAAPAADVVFTRGGDARAWIETTESVRPGTQDELRRLAAMGYRVGILSGDAPQRVLALALARAVEVPHTDVVGGVDAHGKAAWLREHDHDDTLFIGDGVNDALAVERASLLGRALRGVRRPVAIRVLAVALAVGGVMAIVRPIRALMGEPAACHEPGRGRADSGR